VITLAAGLQGVTENFDRDEVSESRKIFCGTDVRSSSNEERECYETNGDARSGDGVPRRSVA
jgi:hypothetical protein